MQNANSHSLIDGPRARVTRWHLAPGAETGHHRHEFDYIIIAITDGTLIQKSARTEVAVSLVSGNAYFRKAGVEHNVANGGELAVTFVEIELLEAG
jgi:quercetin dioxygenase-like cupin family protein